MNVRKPGSRRPEVGPGGRMALADHLRELRNRMLISIAAIVAGIVVAYVFWEPIYDFLRAPYCHVGERPADECNLYALGIFDQFQIRLRVSFIGGALLSSPVWIFHVGRFLTPAMHRNERRYALAFMSAGFVLFSAGVTLAYLTVARGLEIFLTIGGDNVVPLVSVQSYLSFVTVLMIAVGLGFQFPLVVMFLNMTGALTVTRMRSSRRGVYFGLFALSAILVPTTDPFTFLVMAVPMCLLYEVCIVLARIRERRATKAMSELDALEARMAEELGLVDVSAGL